jgi:hypothetical protein
MKLGKSTGTIFFTASNTSMTTSRPSGLYKGITFSCPDCHQMIYHPLPYGEKFISATIGGDHGRHTLETRTVKIV